MKSHQQDAEPEVSQPKTFGLLAATVALAAVGFVLFTNSLATARQSHPLSGSGELLRDPLAAPGAGYAARDPSVPDAAEALRGLRFERPAVDAPTF
jgi:hypothetical protein